MSKLKNIVKEFKLSSWAIRNKISVYLMGAVILIIGLMSYSNMAKESYPEIKQPIIYVNTAYPGNSPVDMENLVTRPIEKEINSLTGLKKLTSTSIQDFSIIVAEFELDVPSDEAFTDIKDAVDRAKPDLPNDLPADPNIMELDFSEFPVMNVNISGDYGYKELKLYAEYLQDEIEKLPEVSGVDISGLQEDEVEIAVDKIKMEALQISFNDIAGAVSRENTSMSGGDIKSVTASDINRRNLRIDGEFKDYREIEDVIVKNEFQNVVYLKDIAEVSFGPKEATSYARLDGQPVLALDVKKKSGENLIEAANKIKAIITKAQETRFPNDLKVTITNDQSKFTISMVSNLENSIIMGVILVVLVLMFFLGLRNSLFVGSAIPLSMLMGIGILNAMGTTLNMMVLFSLILALGMLVDNGIVVVENIYRLRSEKDMNGDRASREGVGEVATAIIASTATTLAAFLPLLFWKDLMGEFMKYLPITLIIVLASSLFVALVINPVLTANFMKVDTGKKSSPRMFWTLVIASFVVGMLFWISGAAKILGGLLVVFVIFSLLYRYVLEPAGRKFMSSVMPKLESWYSSVARWAITGKTPYLLFVATIFLTIGSILFFGASQPKVLFFPDTEPKYVNVFIEAPLGTDIEKTNSIASDVEELVNDAIEPNMNIVEAVLVQVGEKTSDPNEGPQAGSSPHKARITVSFPEYQDRVFVSDVSTREIMRDIREAVKGYPKASITIAKSQDGPPTGKPINVEVSGDNYLELIGFVEKVKQKMEEENVPGVDQLKTDLELGKPMLEVSVNRDAARRFGLSTQQVAAEIRTALLGREISKYKQGEDDYEIQMRFMDKYRYNLNDLMNTKITFRNPANGRISQVPISAVSEIEFNSTYGTVKRRDMKKVITIFSEVQDGYSANEIVPKFKKLLDGMEVNTNFEIKFTGEQEEQNKSVDFMVTAMLFAVFLIFLIIVTQFNSILGPFIIMLSVLFSTIGVFLGFALTGMDFVILLCGIGIISLAGIVVNNAIVLIDYTILLRQRKRVELEMEENELLPLDEIRNTIVDGGRTRLRPVLLTAITTVLGLIPLALGVNLNFTTLLTQLDPQFYMGGDNADFWGPMAWTVIFGLVFATFLTLIIVPVMYYISDRLLAGINKLTARFK